MRLFKRVIGLKLPLFAALLCLQQVQAAELIDRVAAVVNDDIVLESELNNRTQLVHEQIKSQGNQAPSDNVLKNQVLEKLIMDRIQLQIAERQGIRVSDQELNAALQNIADKNNLTLAQFREALIAEGRDYAQAREQIRQEMLLARVQQANVNRRISVSQQEIDNYLASDQASSNVDYQLANILIAVPQSATPEIIQRAEAEADAIYQKLNDGADFPELAVANSDASNALNGGDLGWRAEKELPSDLASAIRSLHPGQYSRPIRTPAGFHILMVRDKRGDQQTLIEQTKVSHILITPNEIRNSTQARQLAEDLYRRLQEGQPFDELARQYSDDAASGSQGGELGWTQPGQMVPEFEQAMNATEIGQISAPFESRFGWHILKVEDRRTQDFSDEMRESAARNAIRKRKYNEEFDNWLREIRSEAYIERKDLK
ncbi:Survival protein SurA precursor (Peptidyl-prolyl cis-trans isomerase SurA) [Marinobacterium lacunae]|uniref:Chaperone SurA n=1 Tax=Marinobacterium lacunae TaxID=1232683 RepID=A0A081FXN7_9GAMM|nr:peptidylprolyl isomerase [Marinobacterium lacunae]KEA63292.1 Survival protein SurA precursor (Peptidyl-prolyl cis-trans isomerase SurA) [Marinobacterium lacunae]